MSTDDKGQCYCRRADRMEVRVELARFKAAHVSLCLFPGPHNARVRCIKQSMVTTLLPIRNGRGVRGLLDDVNLPVALGGRPKLRGQLRMLCRECLPSWRCRTGRRVRPLFPRGYGRTLFRHCGFWPHSHFQNPLTVGMPHFPVLHRQAVFYWLSKTSNPDRSPARIHS